MSHLHLVPPLRDRENLDSLSRKGTLYAARRLRRLGIDDPAAAIELAAAGMDELAGGPHVPHAHEGGLHAFGLLCAAIDRVINRSAGQTGRAN